MKEIIVLIKTAWDRFWFKPAAPNDIAFARIIFYFLMISYYYKMGKSLPLYLKIPKELFFPIPLMDMLHYQVFPIHTLEAVFTVWMVSLICCALGFLFRFSSVVSLLTGAYTIMLKYSFGKVSHSELFLVLVMAIFCFSRASDAWSLDGLFRKKRVVHDGDYHDGDYHWPVQLVRFIWALMFFAAGLSKLRSSGISWMTSDTLLHDVIFLRQVGYNSTSHTFRWSLIPQLYGWFPYVFNVLAGFTIIVELSAPALFLSRRSRYLVFALVSLMQLGIWLVLGINFLNQTSAAIAFMVPISEWSRPRYFVSRRKH